MKKLLTITLAAAFMWGCSKKASMKQADAEALNPEQEMEDIEASIRGKDFTDISQIETIYFDLDSSVIRADMREKLAKNAEFLKTSSKLEIRVDGHCDERGTTEYNMALGQRRAASIRAYYKSLGIPGNRVGTLSWGEEKPFCEESTDSCWSQNRRVETKVRLVEKPSAKKEDEKPKTQKKIAETSPAEANEEKSEN